MARCAAGCGVRFEQVDAWRDYSSAQEELEHDPFVGSRRPRAKVAAWAGSSSPALGTSATGRFRCSAPALARLEDRQIERHRAQDRCKRHATDPSCTGAIPAQIGQDLIPKVMK